MRKTVGTAHPNKNPSAWEDKAIMLQGEIAAYDLFCMLLQRDGMVQLVYKHAVSTVQPAHPLNLAEETTDDVEE